MTIRLPGLLALLLGFTSTGRAFEIGDQVGPVRLRHLDGLELIMTNYAERRGTLMVFLSARSGTLQPEIQTLNEMNSQWRLRGIPFIGVFPNAQETGEEVRQFSQSAGLLFPCYRDPERVTTRQFGAKVTPEAFLLDAKGALVFHGAISRTNEPGLLPALAAFAAGEPIKPNQTPVAGIPIGQAQRKPDNTDPLRPVAFSSELIFESISAVPTHHCSTIAEAANGDLLVVWYGGSYESADDEALFLARRRLGSRSWSAPQVLIRDTAQPPGNAVVFRAGKHQLYIVWARMEASRPLRRGGGWGQTRLLMRTSEDDGFTWSKDALFLGGVLEGLRNVPITLADGELLLPLGHSFARSRDNGRTWEQMGAVAGGGQPTVIERADGSLLTLLRQGPHILQSESRDGGHSWSPTVATGLKNPDAGIAMTRLRNGHLMLVFNDSDSARTPLSIARSLDEGRTWEPPMALESNPGEYSYPCVIQTTDERIHVTYTFRRQTIKHVELNEAWLTQLHRAN